MKKITPLILFILFLSFPAYADTGSCKVIPVGNHTIYMFEWETTDGTFDKPSTEATGLSPPIWGYITGVQFDPGSANYPDSSHNIYLYHKDFNFDYFFALGVGLDGTTRTSTNNYRTPLTQDDGYPALYGVQVGLYVSGPGSGTRNGTVYVVVRNF